MPELAEPGNQPVILVAAGAAATIAGTAVAGYRACEHLPLVGGWLRRGRSELSRRGEHAIEPIRALVSSVAVEIVKLVLQQLDLTELVRDEVDVDAIVADVDIDAIVARIDLVGLANYVIDGVDLPAIIRESTGTVTAEVMSDVRTQGERADDLVSGLVDRVLGRDRDPR